MEVHHELRYTADDDAATVIGSDDESCASDDMRSAPVDDRTATGAARHRGSMTDKHSLLAAVKRHGFALKYAIAELSADREIVTAAVRQNGLSLRYAAATLRADHDIVLLAVQQNGSALQHADASLRMDKEIVTAAVRQDGFALEHAAMTLHEDPPIFLQSLGARFCSALNSCCSSPFNSVARSGPPRSSDGGPRGYYSTYLHPHFDSYRP